MKVHDLWNQFNQAMKNYEEITEDRKRSFDDLKEKDEKSAKEIEMQMRKIQNLVDNISIQKSKIQNNVKESQELNDSIKKVSLEWSGFRSGSRPRPKSKKKSISVSTKNLILYILV
jgi:hypothetical protein